MIGLMTESYCNTIKTENNLNKISNIKKIIQALIEQSIYTLSYVDNLEENFTFREVKTDLMSSISINRQSELLLEKNNYKKTTVAKYNYENMNVVDTEEDIKYFTRQDDFLESIILNCKGITKEISWFTEDNFIVFHSVENLTTEYYYDIASNYKVKDFKIDKNHFIYMTYSTNGKTYLMKSHLAFPFADFNKTETEFNDKYFIYNIEIPNNYHRLMDKDYETFILADDDYNLKKIHLGKFYYFEHDGKYFFNDIDLFPEFEEYIIEKKIQVNSLNVYNYLNFLGLNEFKIDGERKISSFEIDVFKNIFKNKFDNTLNGGLNYYNLVSTFGGEKGNYDLLSLQKDKKYQVSSSDDYFNINGNFVYDFKDGLYKIKIERNKVSLYGVVDQEEKLLKTIIPNDMNEFYFCNLHFVYNMLGPIENKVEYNLEVSGGYTFINKYIDHFEITEIVDNEKSINSLLGNSKIIGIENRKTNVYFNGKAIMFKNFFDYENETFKYGNKTINVVANQKINLNSIKMYHTTAPNYVKNNHVYMRSNGKFSFTKSTEFGFDLVNDKGFITNFWIENQGLEVYFRNKENGIEITTNYNDCDYIVKLPKIKDYFLEDKKSFKNITIDDNDDLESEENYSEELLITEKFMNEPLFYKTVIEPKGDFRLFDDLGRQVLNVIYEKNDERVICYFNPENERAYYYEDEVDTNQYVSVVKAFENDIDNTPFDENGKVKFKEVRKIKSFMIECDKNVAENEIINMVLYNNSTKEVNKIEMSGSEIRTIFDLDVELDEVYLEVPKGYEDVNFFFAEVDVKSIRSLDKILFIKSSRESIVYYSKENKTIDLDSLDLTQVKVYTKYTVDGNKLKESFNGELTIMKPAENQIPITYKDNTTRIESNIDIVCAIQPDKFYRENFKGLGVIFEDSNGVFKKISETFNDNFTTKELI